MLRRRQLNQQLNQQLNRQPEPSEQSRKLLFLGCRRGVVVGVGVEVEVGVEGEGVCRFMSDLYMLVCLIL